MRKLLLLTTLFCAFITATKAQNVAIKTNIFYWGTVSPNAGVEFKAGRKVSLDMSGAYRPWTLWKQDSRFWLVQPEVRYWLCEPFEGHFLGIHLHGAQYYAYIRDMIYDGYLAGCGLAYGYAWILSPHWNLEAVIGFGYARLWYREGPDLPCEKCFGNGAADYIGPTKLSISISYVF